MSKTVVLLELLEGHAVYRRWAKLLFKVVSCVGYRRLVKELQCLMPMVCPPVIPTHELLQNMVFQNEEQYLATTRILNIAIIPERATRSVMSRFLEAKALMRVVTLEKGAGRLARVAFHVAKFRLSLRPSGTRYSGPPAYSQYRKVLRW